MHGDVFPLPLPWQPDPVVSPHLSRGVRQRLDRGVARRRASAECVRALNRLAGSSASEQGHSFENSRIPSTAQSRVLASIWEATEEAPPKGESFESEAALQALLRVDSQYSNGSTGGLAPYRVSAVSLPSDQSCATPLEELLCEQALSEVRDSDRCMLLSSEELEGALDAGVENC